MNEMDTEILANARMNPAQGAIALGAAFWKARRREPGSGAGISIPSYRGSSLEFAAFLSDPNFGVKNSN